MRLFRIVKLYKNVKDKDLDSQKKKMEKLKEMQDKIEKKIQLTSTIKRSNSGSNVFSHQSASLTSSVVNIAKRRRTIEAQDQASLVSVSTTASSENTARFKESRVGKKLSEMTTKRVICLVLILLLTVPLLQAEYFFDDDQSYIFGQKLVIRMAQEGAKINNFSKALREYQMFFDRHVNQRHPLVYSTFPLLNKSYISEDYWDLRRDEMDISTFEDENTKEIYQSIVSLSEFFIEFYLFYKIKLTFY